MPVESAVTWRHDWLAWSTDPHAICTLNKCKIVSITAQMSDATNITGLTTFVDSNNYHSIELTASQIEQHFAHVFTPSSSDVPIIYAENRPFTSST